MYIQSEMDNIEHAIAHMQRAKEILSQRSNGVSFGVEEVPEADIEYFAALYGRTCTVRDDDVCAICLEDKNKHEQKQTMLCSNGHCMFISCLIPVLDVKTAKRCPICRVPFEQSLEPLDLPFLRLLTNKHVLSKLPHRPLHHFVVKVTALIGHDEGGWYRFAGDPVAYEGTAFDQRRGNYAGNLVISNKGSNWKLTFNVFDKDEQHDGTRMLVYTNENSTVIKNMPKIENLIEMFSEPENTPTNTVIKRANRKIHPYRKSSHGKPPSDASGT